MATKYRALRPLWIATNTAAIRKIKTGQHPPFSERGMVRIDAGEISDQIPHDSVSWLLKKGWVELATEGGE